MEVPERWVEAPPGKYRLLLRDKDLHRRWHLARDAPKRGQGVSAAARWLIMNGDNLPGLLLFLLQRRVARLWSRLRCRPEEAEHAWGADDDACGKDEGASDGSAASGSTMARSSAAHTDALKKRLYASAGLLGVYACWTIFAWVIFTYGMLIYKTLGDDAQSQFAQTWGVGYALDNASEWADVAKTAAHAAIVLVILDALRVTRNSKWFEEHGASI